MVAARAAVVLVLAGSGYMAYRSWVTPATSPEDSELARKIRKARAPQGAQQPGVVYVDGPNQPNTNAELPAWKPPTVGPAALLPATGSFEALPPKDRDIADALATRLTAGTTPSPADLAQAEALQVRHADQPMVGQLLKTMALIAADRLTSEKNFVQARQTLERAAALLSNDEDILRATLRVLFDGGDWPATEAMARQILIRSPKSVDARTALAMALSSQGNDREALRAIYSALEVGASGADEASLTRIRDQIERRLWVTSRCEESQLPDASHGSASSERVEKFLAILATCQGGGQGQRVAHFSVSFKRLGDDVLFDKQRLRFASLDSVSRDVVRILEGHYSTLVAALGHQMTRTIPVVILQGEEYHISTGAPAWAGGQFDNEDGTITIPLSILDQVEFVKPEEQRNWEEWKGHWLETVLIHETAHAFIEDLSNGVAPRELHEGLAMFFEREVAKDRTDLTVALQEFVQQDARARYPGDQAAQHAHEERYLGQIFNEIRTAGVVHAGTLNSMYVGGQMYVEYLVRQRSMGGIQDLLKAMAETRSVDQGFEKVYGNGSDGTRRAWLDWLRLQWGVGSARR